MFTTEMGFLDIQNLTKLRNVEIKGKPLIGKAQFWAMCIDRTTGRSKKFSYF